MNASENKTPDVSNLLKKKKKKKKKTDYDKISDIESMHFTTFVLSLHQTLDGKIKQIGLVDKSDIARFIMLIWVKSSTISYKSRIKSRRT